MPSAAGLPEAEGYEHGGLPAFRVRGKRFASMFDERSVNLMPGREAIRAAVSQWPGACREQWFGSRLAAVRVEFGELDPDAVTELVVGAWLARTPRSLVRARPALTLCPPWTLPTAGAVLCARGSDSRCNR